MSALPDPRVVRHPEIVLLDTSVAVALCSTDHVAHADVVAAIGTRTAGLAGHSWFETFSVLTRLPPPQRRSSADVLRMLHHNFPATVFLGDNEQRAFADELSEMSIAGGAIYDALVGVAARSAALSLLSRDTRASTTYAKVGVTVEFID